MIGSWKKWLAAAALTTLVASGPLPAQELQAPEEFSVELIEDRFKGQWSAVTGASFYQVWVERFGRWSFNEKEMDYSPFTSSFELPITDERSRFRVRAVGRGGELGPFSEEVTPIRRRGNAKGTSSKSDSTHSSSSGSDFDPKAPPPPPPTSLFAVWIEHETIKLVWREAGNAKNYAVEEQIDDAWVSVTNISFPRSNTAIIKKHPMPGPYRFRVRSVGSNGRASEPSMPTTAKR